MEQLQPMTDFDPAIVMQEIATKDMELKAKEQALMEKAIELSQAEQNLMSMNKELQAREKVQSEKDQAVANEAATPMIPQEQQGSGSLADNMQPGQKVNMTRTMEMTEDGPMETARSEKLQNAKPAQSDKRQPAKKS